ncbi:MAG: hypothetical protein ACI3YC_01425 [Alloprevotella sp.]
MKKLLILFFVLGALPCAAQSYDYLTLRQTDGSETSFSSDKLKITFNNGMMTLNNGVQSASVALSEVGKMYFASAPTSISTVFCKGNVVPAIRNGRLSVPSGAAVQVYSADGRSLSPDAAFTPGIYLVKVNGKTFKVTAQ